jgi:DNA-binding Lrp family transcriptional regulator
VGSVGGMPLPPATPAIDAADVRIIEGLVADGRANVRSLSATTGLSEEAVAGRVRALVDRNIMRISAVLDWRAAGYRWDLFLSIAVGTTAADAVIDALAARDEVIAIHEVFGPVDLVAHVLCRDRASMLEFLSTTLRRIDGIAAVDVILGLATVKYFHPFAEPPVAQSPLALPHPLLELTVVDHGIIEALIRNGRASLREIAHGLDVADGTIRVRLRRLLAAGLVRICARVHPSNSGMIVAEAFVGISARGADGMTIARRIAHLGEVIAVTVTAGRFDLFCYVAARSRTELVDVIATQIRLAEGVDAVETWEVVAAPKHVAHWARLPTDNAHSPHVVR